MAAAAGADKFGTSAFDSLRIGVGRPRPPPVALGGKRRGKANNRGAHLDCKSNLHTRLPVSRTGDVREMAFYWDEARSVDLRCLRLSGVGRIVPVCVRVGRGEKDSGGVRDRGCRQDPSGRGVSYRCSGSFQVHRDSGHDRRPHPPDLCRQQSGGSGGARCRCRLSVSRKCHEDAGGRGYDCSRSGRAELFRHRHAGPDREGKNEGTAHARV